MPEQGMGKKLDAFLAGIEFPGEDPAALRAFLDRTGFVDRVMERVVVEHNRVRKAILWAAFASANILFLVLLGTNSYINGNYFALQQTLSQFFYLFLSISAVGGIFGFLLTIDTGWFAEWARRHI